METQFNERVGLTVWLYTTKYVNKLKRYGLLHYVSKRMNYVILYVDKAERDRTEERLRKQHFVRDVKDCYRSDLPYTFDDVLKEVEELTKEKKQNEEKEEVSLFTHLSDWSSV